MIPIYQPWITKAEIDAVTDAVSSGWVSSQGKYIQMFEEAFADYIGTKYAIATNNGTSACHLALASCDIGPGDEVIIPDMTFIATANAVKYTGATPVLADVNTDTWNISPSEIRRLIGPKTKAVFATHLFGQLVSPSIVKLCHKNNIMFIEDACEAIGASCSLGNAGAIGRCAAFSFFGNKTITTGEGGMVATDDPQVNHQCRLLCGQGQTDKYYHPIVGYNYRMTNIAAALGYTQLQRIDEILAEKKRVYDTYTNCLADIWPIAEQCKIPGTTHGRWMFAILIKDGRVARVESALKNEGVDTRRMFVPLHNLPPYRQDSRKFPGSTQLYRQGLMLPSYPELTHNQIQFICNIIKGDLAND